MSRALLIENGTLLSTGGTPWVRRGYSVLIEDGRIARVGPAGRFRAFAGRRLDASGGTVIPGLINAHTHAYSALARGLATLGRARDFPSVLRRLWWRLDAALTADDCRQSALLAFVDAVRHGATTIFDHHASPNAVEGSLDAVADAARRTGVRACLSYEVSDRHGRGGARAGIEENVRFIRRCRAAGDARLGALFGLHASFTLSDRTLAEAALLGGELGAGFHVHVAEAKVDQDAARRAGARTVVDRLDRFGVLGERSIAAHCVRVSAREMALLAASGATVAHNPQSNLNNAVGIADLAGLARRGARIGLGTDGMTANLLEEARVALWGQHLARRDPSAGFEEVAAALFGGNCRLAERIFGLPFGEIRAGHAGDLAIFDYDPPTPLASGNALAHVWFGLSQATVVATVAAGRVLLERGRLKLDLDEAELNARGRELARKLWKRL